MFKTVLLLFLQFPLLIFFHLCSKKCVISPRWERGDDAYIGLDIYIILSISLLLYTFTLSPLSVSTFTPSLSIFTPPLSIYRFSLSLSLNLSHHLYYISKRLCCCVFRLAFGCYAPKHTPECWSKLFQDCYKIVTRSLTQ